MHMNIVGQNSTSQTRVTSLFFVRDESIHSINRQVVGNVNTDVLL